MLISIIAFGILGMIAEVAYGALKALLKDRSYELKGATSLWMFPLYGLIAILYPVVSVRISELPWWGRGLIYMCIIYVIQYLVGLLYTKLTVCPWRYADKWSIGGMIYLPQAPLWFAVGLGIEWIWPKIKAISYALS